jgi:CBS domain-containing membrane protein
MTGEMQMVKPKQCPSVELSEDDVFEALRSMQSYVDITPGAFREIYQFAYNQALKRMAGSRRARDIMTVPVHCLHRDMSAPEAAGFMADHGISGAPVLDGAGKVVGIVSEKDFLHSIGMPGNATFMQVIAQCLRTADCKLTRLRDISVNELMSAPPIVALEDIFVAEISALFIERSINRLPICDPKGRPVGIVTRTDLIGAICMRT